MAPRSVAPRPQSPRRSQAPRSWKQPHVWGPRGLQRDPVETWFWDNSISSEPEPAQGTFRAVEWRTLDQTLSVLIRQAIAEDLDVVADLRLQFLAEHRNVEPSQFSAEFRTTTVDFLRRQTEARAALSWLAEQDGVAVGVVAMLLLDLAPRPEDRSGREGYLVNMYVTPSYRRAGIGRALLDACFDAAREISLRRLLLYATDDGVALYARAGFSRNPRWMELSL